MLTDPYHSILGLAQNADPASIERLLAAFEELDQTEPENEETK